MGMKKTKHVWHPYCATRRPAGCQYKRKFSGIAEEVVPIESFRRRQHGGTMAKNIEERLFLFPLTHRVRTQRLRRKEKVDSVRISIE